MPPPNVGRAFSVFVLQIHAARNERDGERLPEPTCPIPRLAHLHKVSCEAAFDPRGRPPGGINRGEQEWDGPTS